MLNPKSGSRAGHDNNTKRSLPSWMSTKEGGCEREDSEQATNATQTEGSSRVEGSAGSEDSKTEDVKKAMPFSKLMKGVVFVLSGFVNPERSTLRSQALEMGAEYKPDWTPECTLLVCAFPNTPKFRQVEADCGTIVSKKWISECYNKKTLVDIEPFLMHAGNPWRRIDKSSECRKDKSGGRPQNQNRKDLQKTIEISASKGLDASETAFSLSKIKEWATSDLSQTMSWLNGQEEAPEPSEVKKIAAEGILTCLQDVTEALEKNQNIRDAIEKWNFFPHIVQELAELESRSVAGASSTKEELVKLVFHCRHVYAAEFDNLVYSCTNKKLKKAHDDDQGLENHQNDDIEYDSDATIEMTEEEIELACRV